MSINKQLRKEVLKRDGYRCQYCGDADSELHIDHIIPASKGGKSTKENLIVACKRCNLSKKDFYDANLSFEYVKEYLKTRAYYRKHRLYRGWGTNISLLYSCDLRHYVMRRNDYEGYYPLHLLQCHLVPVDPSYSKIRFNPDTHPTFYYKSYIKYVGAILKMPTIKPGEKGLGKELRINYRKWENILYAGVRL